jgi:hypothetical protein
MTRYGPRDETIRKLDRTAIQVYAYYLAARLSKEAQNASVTIASV